MLWRSRDDPSETVRLALRTGRFLLLELRGGEIHVGVEGPGREIHTDRVRLDRWRIEEGRTQLRPSLALAPMPRGLAVYDCGHRRGWVGREELRPAELRLRDG